MLCIDYFFASCARGRPNLIKSSNCRKNTRTGAECEPRVRERERTITLRLFARSEERWEKIIQNNKCARAQKNNTLPGNQRHCDGENSHVFSTRQVFLGGILLLLGKERKVAANQRRGQHQGAEDHVVEDAESASAAHSPEVGHCSRAHPVFGGVPDTRGLF